MLLHCTIFLDYINQSYSVSIPGHDRVDDTGKPYHVGDYTTEREIPLQIRVLFNIALFGGLRKGELLALQWNDIDFEGCQIHISKAIALAGGKPIVKCPKTRTSHRTVTLPSSVINMVKALRTEQTRQRLSLGDYWKGDNWLFTQSNGARMSYYTPTQAFHDTLARYNATAKEPLPMIPFHGLWHTSATLLIAGHQDVRTISARLGHAQTSTTMNIYAHALKESDKQAADTLEKMLAKQA